MGYFYELRIVNNVRTKIMEIGEICAPDLSYLAGRY